MCALAHILGRNTQSYCALSNVKDVARKVVPVRLTSMDGENAGCVWNNSCLVPTTLVLPVNRALGVLSGTNGT